MSLSNPLSLRRITPPDVPVGRLVLGLTGNLGAGKSTIARFMELYGARIVDADSLGHRLLESNSPLLDEIIGEFGFSVRNAEGYVDRKVLSNLVFRSPDALKRLNRIVHPVLIREIQEIIREFRSSRENGPLVIDAALIYEWGIQDLFDAVIVVAASIQERQKRIQDVRGIPADEFVRRNAVQLPEEEKIRQADAVFYNQGDLAALRNQVEQFMIR